jgi:predicted Zn-dependent peptidase
MEVELSRLKNGITVATHHMPHLESLALGLWVGAGARSEAPREHGISHLLEHMAFKGTRRRSARDIAETIEAVGGEMNAETSVDHTTYFLRLLKGDVALGLDVLGDIIADPLLDPDELALEQHVILQEIGAAHDVPEDFVFELFQQAAFPGQAIGRSVLGTPDSIRSHSSEDLRRFLGTHYRGPQVVISAAGHLDHNEIVGLAERHLGGLADGQPLSPEPGSYLGGERKSFSDSRGPPIPTVHSPRPTSSRRFSAAAWLRGSSRRCARPEVSAIPSTRSTGRSWIPASLASRRRHRKRI